jgi:hypothetical protein
MKVVLFNPSHYQKLYPFTYIRPVADLRIGLATLRETWALVSGWEAEHLADTDSAPNKQNEDLLWINGALMPDPDLWPSLKSLSPGEAFYQDEALLAWRPSAAHSSILRREPLSNYDFLEYPWQLIQWNDKYLRKIFPILTASRTSQPIDPSNTVVSGPAHARGFTQHAGSSTPGAPTQGALVSGAPPQATPPSGAPQVFIEEGARVSCSILNASTGPIYIGRNAEVMEGCMIRGPLALAEGSVLKMGSKAYGPNSLGPYAVAGGELKNAIIMGYSNKGHDGYLGDSLIGEWCNLGAGTTNSNLRNNASEVRVFNPGLGVAIPTGIKMGLLMGDYSRSAIQSAFHTGAVVGICCNVFGGRPVSGYVPDFSWGLDGVKYDWELALRDIDNWKKLKGHRLSPEEIQKLGPIFGA